MENGQYNGDNYSNIPHEQLEPQEILNTGRFVILCVMTLGLYELWWIYKTWVFFKKKDNLDILPALRAIFSIFFLYSLMERIQEYAKQKGYTKYYTSGGLTAGFIILNILSNLPNPYLLISLFSFAFLIPPFEAFNYARLHSNEYETVELTAFNTRQTILLIAGTVFWIILTADAYGLLQG